MNLLERIGDVMYAFAQWLKSTPLTEFSVWLNDTPAAAVANSSVWIAPVVQTVHILAIAAAFVSVQMISLRVVDLAGAGRTLDETVRRYAPWVWWSLLVLLVTGLALIVAEPARELLNPSFWTKMALILLAIAISLGFQEAVRRGAAGLQLVPGRALALRAAATGVILLWCTIILLGRWIAYAPT